MNVLQKYARWLHTQWPAGRVEKLPVVDDSGRTNVRGLYVAGDLRGIQLLKFAADSGARVVQTIADELRGSPDTDTLADLVDLAIVGAGVAGMAAALEARRLGLSFRVFEANEPFSTIVNFPKGKPIYTYPKDMTPAGVLQVSADVKEALVEELRDQTLSDGEQGEPPIAVESQRVERVRRKGDIFELSIAGDDTPKAAVAARRVVVAIGRSGNFRRLGAPGEYLDKVYNRLHDPKDFCDKRVMVVGGGDSAAETAIALAQCGAEVSLSYRKESLSRPKTENVDLVREHHRQGSIRLMLNTTVKEIREDEIVLESAGGGVETIKNDVVFSMIGREPPLDFLRRCGVSILGDWTKGKVAAFIGFLVFSMLLFNWKSGGQLSDLFYSNNWWPVSIKDSFTAAAQSPTSFVGVIARSASTPSFWYTLAYSVLVVGFGFRRIRRRRTPYITVQTSVLMAIQVLALFLLPEILLPWLGNNGWLPQGFLGALFPIVDYGNGREYWRAYGFILAWPLNVYNVFTDQPLG
ncbi:MAG: NAD(P)-binding domain-containing protein, partial [Candidatus Krumholzibacteria bacterium]|nr:NAD(P)-binding domain-containing protein [Candidatus Krumholzibacteria bacterium]